MHPLEQQRVHRTRVSAYCLCRYLVHIDPRLPSRRNNAFRQKLWCACYIENFWYATRTLADNKHYHEGEEMLEFYQFVERPKEEERGRENVWLRNVKSKSCRIIETKLDEITAVLGTHLAKHTKLEEYQDPGSMKSRLRDVTKLQGERYFIASTSELRVSVSKLSFRVCN